MTGVQTCALPILLRSGQGGLALALFAAAWAPVLLMAAMSLSARTTKGGLRRLPWVSLLCAAIATSAVWWPLAELLRAPPVTISGELGGLSFWLAPIVLVAGVACAGMLGYGERGALMRRRESDA